MHMVVFFRHRRIRAAETKMRIFILMFLFTFPVARSQTRNPVFYRDNFSGTTYPPEKLKADSSFISNSTNGINFKAATHDHGSEKYHKREFHGDGDDTDTVSSDSSSSSSSLQQRDDFLVRFSSTLKSFTPAIALVSLALGTFLTFVLIESPLSPLPVPPLPYPPVGPYPPTNRYPFGVPPVKNGPSNHHYFRMPIRRHGGYGFGGFFNGGQRSAKMMVRLVKVDGSPPQWEQAESFHTLDQRRLTSDKPMMEPLSQNSGLTELEADTVKPCCETEEDGASVEQSDNRGHVLSEPGKDDLKIMSSSKV